MTQHTFRTTSTKGINIEVMAGWDRQLQGFFLSIEDLDFRPTAENDQSYLFESDAYPKEFDVFESLLKELAIPLPVGILEGLQVDKKENLGNKVVNWGYLPRPAEIQQQTPSAPMRTIEKVLVNGYPGFKTQLTLRPGSFDFARSAIGKFPSSDQFSWLMGILEGQEIDATVFSGTNVAGHTTEAQLREAFKTLNPKYAFWIKEAQLESVVTDFGSGRLGFDMSRMYCQQTPAEIDEFIRAHTQEVVDRPSPRG